MTKPAGKPAHRLVYWKCECLNDSNCYSLVARTKWEAAALRQQAGREGYGFPEKVVVEYSDTFDLMCQLTDEGGGR